MERIRRFVPELYREGIEYDAPGSEIRIGVVVPFDFGLDWEYWRYLPEGVALYFTRTPHLRRGVGIELAKDVGKPSVVARGTRALGALDPAVTVYACSSGSFVRGVAGDQEIRRAMFEAGARRAVTASGAMVDALRACGVTRVAVATPYTKSLTLLLGDFLEETGFDPVSLVHLGLKEGIAGVSRSTVANLIRSAGRAGAEGIYLSCTGLRTYGIIAELEEELGLPILTSNQVTLWAGLREADAIPLDPAQEVPGRVLGGGEPMARSTALLLEAARHQARSEAS